MSFSNDLSAALETSNTCVSSKFDVATFPKFDDVYFPNSLAQSLEGLSDKSDADLPCYPVDITQCADDILNDVDLYLECVEDDHYMIPERNNDGAHSIIGENVHLRLSFPNNATVLDTPKRYSCSECNKTFCKDQLLKQHLVSVHGKSLSFNCSQCSFVTNSNRNLLRHVRRAHKKHLLVAPRKRQDSISIDVINPLPLDELNVPVSVDSIPSVTPQLSIERLFANDLNPLTHTIGKVVKSHLSTNVPTENATSVCPTVDMSKCGSITRLESRKLVPDMVNVLPSIAAVGESKHNCDKLPPATDCDNWLRANLGPSVSQTPMGQQERQPIVTDCDNLLRSSRGPSGPLTSATDQGEQLIVSGCDNQFRPSRGPTGPLTSATDPGEQPIATGCDNQLRPSRGPTGPLTSATDHREQPIVTDCDNQLRPSRVSSGPLSSATDHGKQPIATGYDNQLRPSRGPSGPLTSATDPGEQPIVSGCDNQLRPSRGPSAPLTSATDPGEQLIATGCDNQLRPSRGPTGPLTSATDHGEPPIVSSCDNQLRPSRGPSGPLTSATDHGEPPIVSSCDNQLRPRWGSSSADHEKQETPSLTSDSDVTFDTSSKEISVCSNPSMLGILNSELLREVSECKKCSPAIFGLLAQSKVCPYPRGANPSTKVGPNSSSLFQHPNCSRSGNINSKSTKGLFTCSHRNCGKDFATSRQLSKHCSSHFKQVICPWPGCEMKFRDKHGLQTHQYSHNAIKPKSCDLCAFKYVQKASLDWHMKRKHTGKSKKRLKKQTIALFPEVNSDFHVSKPIIPETIYVEIIKE